MSTLYYNKYTKECYRERWSAENTHDAEAKWAWLI
jgi:hypothetical protein